MILKTTLFGICSRFSVLLVERLMPIMLESTDLYVMARQIGTDILISYEGDQ